MVNINFLFPTIKGGVATKAALKKHLKACIVRDLVIVLPPILIIAVIHILIFCFGITWHGLDIIFKFSLIYLSLALGAYMGFYQHTAFVKKWYKETE